MSMVMLYPTPPWKHMWHVVNRVLLHTVEFTSTCHMLSMVYTAPNVAFILQLYI